MVRCDVVHPGPHQEDSGLSPTIAGLRLQKQARSSPVAVPKRAYLLAWARNQETVGLGGFRDFTLSPPPASPASASSPPPPRNPLRWARNDSGKGYGYSDCGDLPQSALHSGEVVLQTEVEHLALPGGVVLPNGLALGDAEAKPQPQPALADLAGAAEEGQSRLPARSVRGNVPPARAHPWEMSPSTT